MTSKYAYEKVWTGPETYQIRQQHTKKVRAMKSEDNPDYLIALAAGEVTEVPYIPPTPYVQSLAEKKQTRIRDFMNRTSEIMQEGFAYDGKVFSLSNNDLGDWAWLAIYDSLGKLTFPRSVSTKDGGEYIIANKQVFSHWMDAGIARALTLKDECRAKRVAVLAAVDEAGLEAVVDNR